MIKIIAFDLVGVLVKETNITLEEDLTKIERLFGPNKSDSEFIKQVKHIFPAKNEKSIVFDAKEIINKLYEPKITLNSLTHLKKKLNNISFVIVTNHVSFIKDYILKTFGSNVFSSIYISALMNEVKPETTFYQKLLEKLNIKPTELLFLDDNISNINGATALGIKTIHISKKDNTISKIEDYFNMYSESNQL